MVLNKDIPAGKPVCWSDVDYDATQQAIQFRLEMEKLFRR
jgi:hypothetical protein